MIKKMQLRVYYTISFKRKYCTTMLFMVSGNESAIIIIYSKIYRVKNYQYLFNLI